MPGFMGSSRRPGEGAQRWTIRAGQLTQFSDDCWQMGYGGWCIYFEPALVRAVVKHAAEFPPTLDADEGYRQICEVVRRQRSALKNSWESVVPAG